MITRVWLSEDRCTIVFAEDDGQLTDYDTETGRDHTVDGFTFNPDVPDSGWIELQAHKDDRW